MSGVTRIGHMGMRVTDLDAAVAFQAEVLGLVETERRGRTAYLTCNERHHELILIESGKRGYDHIGLELADAAALEGARRAIGAAGGEALGEVYDGEPGIDRAALVRGPGGHVYKLFCGMETVAAPPAGDRPTRFEHASVKARNLGPTERFLAAGLGFAFSDRMGRTASWWHCEADHHGMALIFGPRHELSHYAWSVPDLNAMGRIADRLAARGQQADLGAEPPRARPQPLHLLQGRRRGDGRVLRRPGGDAAARRLPGQTLARRLRRDQPVGRPAAAPLPARRPPDRQLEPRGLAAMKLRSTPEGLIAERADGGWVALPAVRTAGGSGDGLSVEETTDMIAFLAGGERTRIAAAAGIAAADPDALVDPGAATLPFRPRSMRAFMLWESHYVASARALVEHFFPPAAAKAVAGYERLTRRTFPKLKPNRRFHETPSFYLANHTAPLGDGEEMWWPSHTEYLDFELELAFVLARPLVDATAEEAAAAVGGWFVLNDWSARDVQAEDLRESPFGPVVKSKTFANSIGPDVITADALPDWQAATGRVRVDGELWCEGTTAGAAHDVGAMLAYASAGERLEPGDVISTGTMPGCCGLELGRWIRPGQTVELEIDGIGTLRNRIGPEATPR